LTTELPRELGLETKEDKIMKEVEIGTLSLVRTRRIKGAAVYK
jgi:hypothetical protein